MHFLSGSVHFWPSSNKHQGQNVPFSISIYELINLLPKYKYCCSKGLSNELDYSRVVHWILGWVLMDTHMNKQMESWTPISGQQARQEVIAYLPQ